MRSTRRAFLGAAAVGAGLGAVSPRATAAESGPFGDGPAVGLRRVAAGLTAPIGIVAAPEDRDRRFVADQTGEVYVQRNGGLRAEPFLDVSDQLVDLSGYEERGLLGIAFHPEFASNGRLYVYYSAPRRPGTPREYDHTGVLSEWSAATDLERVDPNSERVLLEVPQPQANHNGGGMAFGQDGYLYLGLGDGGGAGDSGPGHVSDWYEGNDGGNGQDVTENLLGSVLRLDVDSQSDERPYGVPDTNPLVGREGLDEQYAWGFRNPWRLSVSEGRLFVADVGQNNYEEIDLVEPGGNYGWNVREGTHCYAATDCPDRTPDGKPLLPPVAEYPQRAGGRSVGSAVVGGHVADGPVPELAGSYLFGDWSRTGGEPAGRLLAATPGQRPWPIDELTVATTDDGRLGRYVLGFGQDGDASYVCTSQSAAPTGTTGEVFELVPSGEGDMTAGGDPGTGPTDGTGRDTTRDDTDDEETVSDGTPGFGVGAAAAGAIVAGWRALRERR